jgi:plasmid stabilization system protein ParE
VPGQYKLRYLPLFWDDLEQAVFYIRDVLKNPSASKRLLDRTEQAILEHAEAPTMAQVYKTTRSRPQPYFWFAVGDYMVFYVVIDDVMEVRRFIYGTRDLNKMLF